MSKATSTPKDKRAHTVVFRDDALNKAAEWIGEQNKSAVRSLFDEAGRMLPQPRAEGLGLGAKFVSHKKDVLRQSRVEQILAKKLNKKRHRAPQAIRQAPYQEDNQLSKATMDLKKNAKLKKRDLLKMEIPSKKRKKQTRHQN